MHMEPYPACDGSGSETKRLNTCTRCDGSGNLRQPTKFFFVKSIQIKTCNECNGKGTIPEKVCKECRGSGHSRVKRKVSVHIPAGISNRMHLRFEELGDAGNFGVKSGDLVIEVHIPE